MRVVIIGGSHAGIATARHLKKINETVEVVIIEKSNVLGYIGSSMNLYLEGFIEKLEDARTVSASQLLSEQITVVLNAQVTTIDPVSKSVTFTSVMGEQLPDSLNYDYLVLAMGSSQYNLEVSEQEQKSVTSYKTLSQAKEAAKSLKKASCVAIVGAGLIGFELAESLSQLGKEVYLIDRMDSILFRYFDSEITQAFQERIPANVHVLLNSNVRTIEVQEPTGRKELVLMNGDVLSVDEIIYAINPRPNVELVSDILEMNMDGTIVTDPYLATSDPFIYAVGDLISVLFNHSEMPIYIPLVTNAYRTGMIAASNILREEKIPLPKVQRTIVSHLFGCFLASCGINEEEAPYYGFEVSSVTRTFGKNSLFDDSNTSLLMLKLVYHKETKQLMGAQLMTNTNCHIETINTLSSLITMNATLHQLVTMDFYFNPKLSMPLHFLNELALDGVIHP